MTTTQPTIGRPRKAPDEQRSESLPAVRVTAAERVFVEAQAAEAGLSLSDYCRRLILRRAIGPARSTSDEAALVALNRVGVNLNQIARHANAGRALPAQLDDTLAQVRDAVAKVVGGGS